MWIWHIFQLNAQRTNFHRRSPSRKPNVIAGIRAKFHIPKVTDADNRRGNRIMPTRRRTDGKNGAIEHSPWRTQIKVQLQIVYVIHAVKPL
mmetsp:Transcript_1682/g.3370  ORF Transcript_1682/g.3370 Transcript_1682/m.3370 type:complete len:91 (-) Transcript_1682:15-287(-)